MRIAAFSLLACVASLATRVDARDLFVRRHIVDPSGRVVEEVQGWTGRRMVTAGPLTRSIVDFDAQSMVTIDRRTGARSVATLEELRRRNDASLDRARRVFQRLPAHVREQAQAMGADPRARFSIRRTGTRGVVAGLSASEYRVEDGPITGILWIARDVPIPRETCAWQRLSGDSTGLAISGTKLADTLGRMCGLLMSSELTGPGGATVRTDVVEVRSDDVPDAWRALADPDADD